VGGQPVPGGEADRALELPSFRCQHSFKLPSLSVSSHLPTTSLCEVLFLRRVGLKTIIVTLWRPRSVVRFVFQRRFVCERECCSGTSVTSVTGIRRLNVFGASCFYFRVWREIKWLVILEIVLSWFWCPWPCPILWHDDTRNAEVSTGVAGNWYSEATALKKVYPTSFWFPHETTFSGSRSPFIDSNLLRSSSSSPASSSFSWLQNCSDVGGFFQVRLWHCHVEMASHWCTDHIVQSISGLTSLWSWNLSIVVQSISHLPQLPALFSAR
jgi:hypothetical protein